MSNNQSGNFWDEVRRINKPVKSVSSVIDGVSETNEIVDIFFTKFKQLYNSVPCEEEQVKEISKKIEAEIPNDFKRLLENNDCCLSVPLLSKTVEKLKKGKHDGHTGLLSDCILHGPHLLNVFLSLLFSAMLIHGYAPNDMLIGTMTPIPKLKNMCILSDKYRAITLSSCIGKLFDLALLYSYGNCLTSDDLQFGFKCHSSTAICTSLLKEVSSHFVNKGSHVYCLFLDATKAFDKIDFIKLFDLLLKSRLNVIYTRLLLYMYSNQTLRVNWQGNYSEQFTVTNGVKQGGGPIPNFILYLYRCINEKIT